MIEDLNKPAPRSMKCLTICQPWAWGIVGDVRARCTDTLGGDKSIENRTWSTAWRGELLLQAGKSDKYLGTYGPGELPKERMTFGAIVGVASLVAVLEKGRFGAAELRSAGMTAVQIEATRRFIEGPYCFVLVKKRRFVEPVPYVGKQGFFDVPISVVHQQLQKAVAV